MRMEEIIKLSGRVPRQRTTLYGTPAPGQTDASFQAGPLLPVVTGGGKVAV
jgi:FO synthase